MDKEPSPPGEFGIFDPYSRDPKAFDEGPVRGPSTFTVAPNGDIYIVDTFNHRIQRFTQDGNFVSSIPAVGCGEDICVDANGNIYFLCLGPATVWKVDHSGKVLKIVHMFNHKDPDAEGMNTGGGSTKLFCDNSGRLFLEYYSEKSGDFKIFQFGTATADFTPEQQKATLRKGFVGGNGLTLNQDQIFGIVDGKMYLLDNQSKTIKEYKHGANPWFLVGTDTQGNIYLLVFDMTKDTELVKKYSPEGSLISVVEWKSVGYAKDNLDKLATIDSQGNIYVFDSTKSGITITKWSPGGAGK
jgi:hypothetical protein